MIRWRVGNERNDIDIRRSAAQDGRDLGNVRTAVGVIGEKEDDVSALPLPRCVRKRAKDGIADDDWLAAVPFVGKPFFLRIGIGGAAQARSLRRRGKQVGSCAGGQRAHDERNAT